jgi:hypothetical protein
VSDVSATVTKPNLRDPDTWLPRDLFAAYCGPRSDGLLAYYDKAKAKRNMIVFSFDWLAFFLLPAWLGYRRQWVLWTTLVVTVAVLSVAASVARVKLPSGAFTGGLLAAGMMAQGSLLTTANGRYLKLKQQGLSDNAIRGDLANKASPHRGFALAGLAGAIAIQLLTVLLTSEQ